MSGILYEARVFTRYLNQDAHTRPVRKILELQLRAVSERERERERERDMYEQHAFSRARVEQIGFITKSPKFICGTQKRRPAFTNKWLKCNYRGIPVNTFMHQSWPGYGVWRLRQRRVWLTRYRAGRACCEEQRGILPDAGILSTGFAWSEDIRARGGALVDARVNKITRALYKMSCEKTRTHIQSIVMSINGGFNGNMVGGGWRRCK